MTTLAQKLGQSMIGHHCLDFRDHDAVFAAIHSAQESLQTIDMVLIAHGDLGNQAATQEDYSLAFQTYETNLLSVIRFLLPLSAALAGQGHGKIAVITSVAGDRGRPRNYTYGSAKGALSLYLQGMRSRLWRSGVEIYDIKLGPVVSPMTKDHTRNFSFATADEASLKIVRALARKRYIVYVPGFWRYVLWVVKSLPEPLLQRIPFLLY